MVHSHEWKKKILNTEKLEKTKCIIHKEDMMTIPKSLITIYDVGHITVHL